MRRTVIGVLAGLVLSMNPTSANAASPCGAGNFAVKLTNSSSDARAACSKAPALRLGAKQEFVADEPYEYRVVMACGAARVSDTVAGSATNCSFGLTACRYRGEPGENLYRIEYRRKDQPDAPWQVVRETCGLDDVPPGVPAPVVPTIGQLQTAFRQLPFSRPTVAVQPEGNVTLVNLPTWFRATWPSDAGLQPGEVSESVQLLSWSVEFRIASRSYDFHYGDGSSSGPLGDAGGTYPDGRIRHTYAQPTTSARVTVDAQLTGQFRVNGGDWVDIDTVADLQDEPVTVLQVKEATARLVR